MRCRIYAGTAFHRRLCKGRARNPASGRWEDDTLVFESRGESGLARFTYNMGEPNAYSLRIEFSEDGATWEPFLSGRYRRQNAS